MRRRHVQVDTSSYRAVGFVIVGVGCLVISALVLVAVIIALTMVSKPVPAQSQQIRIPPACAKLAALFEAKLPEIFSRIEAEAALTQINWRMILVPEARRCRAAIKKELKK